MIVIIDYDMGNLRSVQNGFAQAGFSTIISGDPQALKAADGLVLPGVGAFGRAMDNLCERGLDQLVYGLAKDGVPILGICVGLQLLFDCSEELGKHRGLSLIPGQVVKFGGELKVPHVGWNQLEIKREHKLLHGVHSGDYVYFVHSYYAQPVHPQVVLAVSEYGGPFTAVVQHGNIFGIQFHPEKSSRVGIRILQNFGSLVEG
ncbi:MAG: imidazole glycerol phosphate synthase subunit HisH [Syntrophomonadaceae bacterium]|jgi:glutamine amidotransferase